MHIYSLNKKSFQAENIVKKPEAGRAQRLWTATPTPADAAEGSKTEGSEILWATFLRIFGMLTGYFFFFFFSIPSISHCLLLAFCLGITAGATQGTKLIACKTKFLTHWTISSPIYFLKQHLFWKTLIFYKSSLHILQNCYPLISETSIPRSIYYLFLCIPVE